MSRSFLAYNSRLDCTGHSVVDPRLAYSSTTPRFAVLSLYFYSNYLYHDHPPDLLHLYHYQPLQDLRPPLPPPQASRSTGLYCAVTCISAVCQVPGASYAALPSMPMRLYCPSVSHTYDLSCICFFPSHWLWLPTMPSPQPPNGGKTNLASLAWLTYLLPHTAYGVSISPAAQ